MTNPIPIEYPFIQLGCDLCPNTITLPENHFIVCTNCHNRVCVECGEEQIKLYGNKFLSFGDCYCNKCDACNSDYADSSDDEYK